ncbi:stimulator of interferon genes protein-like [Dendronephthya gigantea]|uniref:stimulator of interferon genes protein-like n=1 Tax=Dendronephthya gigantea TaxID=151771 RepID=UPI00106B4383|nr:stimulator of interferon genes protein-like [Dendronephthya gigantea]
MATPENGNSTPQRNETYSYGSNIRHDTGAVPIKKRGKRAKAASIIISASAAIATVSFLIVAEEGKEKFYLWLFPSLLGLFSVFAGALVSRMCLLFEECRHISSRHNGSKMKMFKFCFKGIDYGAIGACMGLIIMVLAGFMIGGLVELDYKHGAILCSGVGIGPLILQVLKLDTLSAVHIETILEDQQTYVANVLAWHYYYNYLKETLPEIPDLIKEAGLQNHLSTMKLIILIPLDCDTAVEISTVDPNHFTKKGSLRLKKQPNIKLHVYEVKSSSGKEYTLVMQLAKIPLDTLDYMSKHADILSVHKKSRQREIKLFYQTLNDILADCEKDCRHRCLLVTYHTKKGRDGTLANEIVRLVNSETFSHAEDDVFDENSYAATSTTHKGSTSTRDENTAHENTDHESTKCDLTDDMATSGNDSSLETFPLFNIGKSPGSGIN